MRKTWKKFQSHPLASIACIFAGGLFGKFFPAAGAVLGPVGYIFLSLFKMCALPIVVTIIVESFYRLMSRGDRTAFILRAFGIFALGSLGGTFLGILSGRIASPLVTENPGLMRFLSDRMATQPHLAAPAPESAIDFVVHFIPQNIFHSLSEGQIVSCLIFFALFGAALARVPSARREDVYEAIRAIKEALFKMLGWFIQFLPVAVFAIFAHTFAGVRGDAAKMLGELALICAIPILTLLALQALSIVILRRAKVASAWDALREPLLIAFSSTSSIVALPSAMRNMSERGKVQEWAAETVMPLSVTFNPQANLVFGSFLMTFCAQISGMALTTKLLGLIAFGSLVQAFCSSGLPSLATLGTLAMIFGPLGLPVDLVIVLMIAIVPFLSPFLAAANILGHAWAALLVERRAEPSDRD